MPTGRRRGPFGAVVAVGAQPRKATGRRGGRHLGRLGRAGWVVPVECPDRARRARLTDAGCSSDRHRTESPRTAVRGLVASMVVRVLLVVLDLLLGDVPAAVAAGGG